MTCDDWHATYEQLERQHVYLHYFWQRSHQGQLPEAAADVLAKAGLTGGSQRLFPGCQEDM